MKCVHFTPILIAFAFTIILSGCRRDNFTSVNNQTIATVQTFAGIGERGYKDGPRSSAEFSLMNFYDAWFDSPNGVATDAQGNVYVADAGNKMIRKVKHGGVVSTFAPRDGDSIVDFVPFDVATDNNGNVYVSDAEHNRILKFSESGVIAIGGDVGFEDGPAAKAKFASVRGVATDNNGNVFVADAKNNRIRKISSSTGQVSTLAGNENAGYLDGRDTLARFNEPSDVATDAQGNVYVTDLNSRVRKITLEGMVTTLAGGEPGYKDGKGVAAQFNEPFGLAVDAQGNVFVSEKYRIRKIAPSTEVSTLAGSADNADYVNGKGKHARFFVARGIAADAGGNVYVADSGNHCIRKISVNAEVSKFAGSAGIQGFSNNDGDFFETPAGITMDIRGNIFVADMGNNCIRKISPDGIVSTFAGSKEPGFTNGQGSAASFHEPSGLATDILGSVYVADRRNFCIRKITADGNVTTLAEIGNRDLADSDPVGVGTDSKGNVYVADASNDGGILKVTPTGVVTPFATGVSSPWGIALDLKDNLYVADQQSIKKITPAGIVSIVAGPEPGVTTGYYGYSNGNGAIARFNTPISLSVDAQGNIFVADLLNHRIRKITPVGNDKYAVSTLAGSGVPGFVDGEGTNAMFHLPTGLTIDAAGSLYVADAGNHSIRKIVMR